MWIEVDSVTLASMNIGTICGGGFLPWCDISSAVWEPEHTHLQQSTQLWETLLQYQHRNPTYVTQLDCTGISPYTVRQDIITNYCIKRS